MNSDHSKPRPDRVMLGISLMVTAVFMMSIQEALFKQFSANFSLWQLFTLRGLLALPLLAVIILIQGQPYRVWVEALGKWPLLRSLFLTMMFIPMYAAIPFLNLSTVAAGMYTAPLFVALMSAYVIGEPVGLIGWIAVAMGFAGVLVILQPGADAFSFLALLPVLGGFFYALSNITTRSKCQSVSLSALALSLNLTLLTAGLVFSVLTLFLLSDSQLPQVFPFLFSGWAAIDNNDWLLIILLAVLVVMIGMTLAGAYQAAAPTTVATFDYSYLIFMVLWDYLFFDTPPNSKTVIGIILIFSAGILIVQRRR